MSIGNAVTLIEMIDGFAKHFKALFNRVLRYKYHRYGWKEHNRCGLKIEGINELKLFIKSSFIFFCYKLAKFEP